MTTKAAIAGLKATEPDRHRDFIDQTATTLYPRPAPDRGRGSGRKDHSPLGQDTLGVLGVNVAAKRGPNRAISAQGWWMLRRRLTDKAATCGLPWRH